MTKWSYFYLFYNVLMFSCFQAFKQVTLTAGALDIFLTCNILTHNLTLLNENDFSCSFILKWRLYFIIKHSNKSHWNLLNFLSLPTLTSHIHSDILEISVHFFLYFNMEPLFYSSDMQVNYADTTSIFILFSSLSYSFTLRKIHFPIY